MSQVSDFCVERCLLDTLSAYYDIEPVKNRTPLQAICSFHARDSRYVLSKKAELWAAEHHEYLYLYSVSHLDLETLRSLWEQMLEDGIPRIKPHIQHMYTYLTAVIFYETAEADALEQLKRFKRRREFKLSLHGWMESRIAAVDRSTAALTVNRAGRTLKKDLGHMVEGAISKCNERRNNT